MAITILGITLGGEAAKKKEAVSAYAIKYPISGDVNQLRQNLGRATIELSNLRGQTPNTAADKRTQKRNITALTTQTINLQNAINDASLYMGNANNNFKIKTPSSDSFILKSPYSSGTSKPLVQQPIKKTTPKVGTQYRKPSVIVGGLDEKPTQEQVVDNTDGGQPQLEVQTQGAKGDYPPPQGVQGTNYGKWIGITALVAGIGTLGYVYFKKKK